jgi:hypothetical protein
MFRADFLPFASKTVEHSRYLPAAFGEKNMVNGLKVRRNQSERSKIGLKVWNHTQSRHLNELAL